MHRAKAQHKAIKRNQEREGRNVNLHKHVQNSESSNNITELRAQIEILNLLLCPSCHMTLALFDNDNGKVKLTP